MEILRRGRVFEPLAWLGAIGLLTGSAWAQEPSVPSPTLPSVPPPVVAPNFVAPGPGGAAADIALPAAENPAGGAAPTEAIAADEAADGEEGTLLMRLLGAEDSPVQIYGWIQNSYTGNPAQPSDNINWGVNPNWKANTWMGNQYYIVGEKALDLEKDWDWGFRVDNLFGHDWQFNKMYGLFDRAFNPGQFTGYDMAQAYGEIHTPFLSEGGIDFKFGRWYTLHGYEVVPAIGRPLLSVPYMFNYGQPFTHTGLMTTWHATEKLNIFNGTTNGWDRWFNQKYRWGYMGGFAWTFGEDDAANLTMIYSGGPNQYPVDVRPNFPLIPTGTAPGNIGYGTNPNYNDNWRHLWTAVLSYAWNEKLTQVMEVDAGIDRRMPGLNGVAPNGIELAKTASWYAFGNWFLYSFNDKLTGVWRSEIFRDQTGVRIGVPGRGDNFAEMTLGLIYKPKSWMWIRPEARYDWAQTSHPYNGGVSSSQFTIGLDWIFLF
jgi:hypothetical protein